MIQVVVLLRAGDAGLAALRDYERQALAVLADHGGRLISAFEPVRETGDAPDEVHILEFPSPEALASYRGDPRIEALSGLRESAIAATTVYISRAIVEYSE